MRMKSFPVIWCAIIYIGAGTVSIDISSVNNNKVVASEENMPQFTEDVKNITVVVGRSAKLKCSVINLSKYKIAWIKSDTQTLLSIENTMITRNYRLRASYSDLTTWFLHIKEASMSDRGYYMCQINTVPPLTRQGFLEVVVPPNIIDDKLSTDVEVAEDSPAQLKCMATGYPAPEVKFRRQEGRILKRRAIKGKVTTLTITKPEEMKAALKHNMDSISLHQEILESIKDTVLTVAYLTFDSVSRLDMGHYLCIASNSVPPSVSKRMVLNVRYREPEIVIVEQMLGVYRGDDVALNCTVTAYPRPVVFWQDKSKRMIISGGNFHVYEIQLEESPPVLQTTLLIRNIDVKEISSYTCNASIDNDESRSKSMTIVLNEMIRPSTYTPRLDFIPQVQRKSKNILKPYQPRKTNDINDIYENIPTIEPEKFMPPSVDQKNYEVSMDVGSSSGVELYLSLFNILLGVTLRIIIS